MMLASIGRWLLLFAVLFMVLAGLYALLAAPLFQLWR
jgi:uncharacterized protein involved in exopolysaccharide biosynthesis